MQFQSIQTLTKQVDRGIEASGLGNRGADSVTGLSPPQLNPP